MNLRHEAELVAKSILRCAGPEADSPAAVAYATRCVLALIERVSEDGGEPATVSVETLAAIGRNSRRAAEAQNRAADDFAALYWRDKGA